MNTKEVSFFESSGYKILVMKIIKWIKTMIIFGCRYFFILLLNDKCNVFLDNKVLLYKTILEPILTYKIDLCGYANKSNIILTRYYNLKISLPL